MRMRCALAVLLVTASSFAADLHLGPAIPLDKTIRRDAPPSAQSGLQMLWLGGKGFAAWVDQRGQYPPNAAQYSPVLRPSSVIYGSPMRADGSLVIPNGKPLIEGAAFSLAAVDESHIRATVYQAADRIFTFPIDMEGNILAEPKLDFAGALYSDGKTFLARNGQLYDRDGNPLIRTTFTATSIATVPGLYLGTRGGTGNVVVQTLLDDGTFNETKIASFEPSVSYHAAIAAADDRALVAVESGGGIDAFIVDRKGALLRTTAVARGAGEILTPFWDGTSFLVMWMAPNAVYPAAGWNTWTIHSRRIAPNGDILDFAPAGTTIIAASAGGLTNVRTPSGFILRWTEQPDTTPTDIAGTSFLSNADLVATAPAATSLAVLTAGAQMQIRFAPHSKVPIATWREFSRTSRIMMSIGDRTFEVASSSTRALANPVVIRSNSQIFVAWRSLRRVDYWDDELADGEIFARRFTLDGTPADEAPLRIGDGPPSYAGLDDPIEAALEGNDFIVMWGTTNGLNLSRVSAAGSVAMPGINTGNNGIAPHAIATGNRLFVVWSYTEPHSPFWTRVVTAPVSTVPVDPGSLALIGPSVTRSSAASDDAGNTLVVWSDSRCVTGMLLDNTAAVVLGPKPIACEEHQNQTAVAWSGSEFVVAWSKYDKDGGVRGMRVDPFLRPIDDNPFDIAAGAYEPSLVQNGSGVTIGYVATGVDEVPRAFTRTLDRLGALPRTRPVVH